MTDVSSENLAQISHNLLVLVVWTGSTREKKAVTSVSKHQSLLCSCRPVRLPRLTPSTTIETNSLLVKSTYKNLHPVAQVTMEMTSLPEKRANFDLSGLIDTQGSFATASLQVTTNYCWQKTVKGTTSKTVTALRPDQNKTD